MSAAPSIRTLVVVSVAAHALSCAASTATPSSAAPHSSANASACAPHQLAVDGAMQRQVRELRAAAALSRAVPVRWECSEGLKPRPDERLTMSLQPAGNEICSVQACGPSDPDTCMPGLFMPVALELRSDQRPTTRSPQPGELVLSTVSVELPAELVQELGFPADAGHVQEDVWLQLTPTAIALDVSYGYTKSVGADGMTGGSCKVRTETAPVPGGSPERPWQPDALDRPR
jgi:hypothetical protein